MFLNTVDLHEHLVQVPPPVAGFHALDAALPDLGGEHRPKRRHQNRTVSWQMSVPRSCSRSSTFVSESGKRTYIVTAKRMISGLLWKYLKGSFLLIPEGYGTALPASTEILLTAPGPMVRAILAAIRHP